MQESVAEHKGAPLESTLKKMKSNCRLIRSRRRHHRSAELQ